MATSSVNAANGATKSWDDYWNEIAIGKGAFGKVYRVTEPSTGNFLCIKEQILKSAGDHAVADRELRTLQSLDRSPWVVNFHTSFQDGLSMNLVFDYCKNGDLHELIRKHGFLHVDLVRQYSAELIMGLEFLRLQRIVHRDLKPKNILLDASWHLKIADFGFAYKYDPAAGWDQHHLIGTRSYMSPEQLRRAEITFASDVWSVGCIIFEMFTGQFCFKPKPLDTVFTRILAGTHTPWPSDKLILPPDKLDLGDDIRDDVIYGMLKADPGRRCGTRDFNDLKSWYFFRGMDWNHLHTNLPTRFNAATKALENKPVAKHASPPKPVPGIKASQLVPDPVNVGTAVGRGVAAATSPALAAPGIAASQTVAAASPAVAAPAAASATATSPSRPKRDTVASRLIAARNADTVASRPVRNTVASRLMAARDARQAVAPPGDTIQQAKPSKQKPPLVPPEIVIHPPSLTDDTARILEDVPYNRQDLDAPATSELPASLEKHFPLMTDLNKTFLVPHQKGKRTS